MRGVRTLEFPVPPPEALEASARLSEVIAARIRDAGGWIGFDSYLQAALYEPGLGYYSGGAVKFGAAGDFVTAPEISPLFGACIAAQCAQWFEHTPKSIVEFGAGSGALAVDVLAELEQLGHSEVDYAIVELSGELRARQRETLRARLPKLARQVRWLDQWPDAIDGVVLGNEVLDAIPARTFSLRNGRVFERGVALAGERPGFEWAERPADVRFDAAVRARLAGPIADAEGFWPDEYESELGMQAEAWIAEVGRRLRRGAALLLDYGFPGAEFYHPQRRQGTLMCHYRHIAHHDPFRWPGLQDITVHVDFSAIAAAGVGAGLDLLGYTSQAALLFNLGLLDRLGRVPPEPAPDHLRAMQGAKRLLSEAEMGELFKAIAFGRGMPGDALGFGRSDRSGRL